MAVVIRLQGLPVVAGSVDIRNFFTGLNIPDGGVHIIGGKLGEAFIIFTTDEDARRAMSRTGGIIKKSQVQLFLSSKSEMQNTLEMNRKGGRDSKSDSKHSGDVHKLLEVIKKKINQKEYGKEMKKDSGFDDGVRHPERHPVRNEMKLSNEQDTVYLFLFGLPYSVTVDDIRNFFHGLSVVEVLFLKRLNGAFSGNGFVKFGSIRDANAGLQRNNEYIGHRFISIKKSNEEEWIKAGGKIQKTSEPIPKNRAYSPKSGNSYSHSKNQSHSTSPPKKQRARSRSPHNQQFYIHLKNLSYSVDKLDIKYLLGVSDMADSQIKFLFDKQNNRTREGFVVLQNERQYEKCLGLNGLSDLSGRPVYISPISRKAMLELIESQEILPQPKRDNSEEKRGTKRNLSDSHTSVRKCIYIRNFPFDVTKHEVQKFFDGYSVFEDDIVLLYDDKGLGLGEALVNFPSEQQAILAENLNHQRFLGTEVFLKRISDEQKKEFGLNSYTTAPYKDPRQSPSYQREYLESVQSHDLPSHSLRFSDDFTPLSGNFLGSLEEFRNPYQKNFGGEQEPFGMFDMVPGNIMGYHDAAPLPSQTFGSPNDPTTIVVKNMPFNATSEEILDFFYGYHVIPDSIDIKLTKSGFSTGIATVCFENSNEALAAVNELNGRPIGQRKVSLSLAKNT